MGIPLSWYIFLRFSALRTERTEEIYKDGDKRMFRNLKICIFVLKKFKKCHKICNRIKVQLGSVPNCTESVIYKVRILLVEDNRTIAKGLMYNLEQNGYEVKNPETVEATKKILEEEKFDLVILDISLPDGDGFDLYKTIKEKYNIKTIFLTARDEEDNVVKGLELGAEDYITKPFSTRELLARINKIFLREKKNNIVKIKDITCDLDKMCAYKGEKAITFSSLELKILMLLFTNINKVVTREYIIEKIWDWTGNDVYDNTVTVYMKRIREKLVTPIITTIKGVGYRIDEE